jgi:hypothetical protein
MVHLAAGPGTGHDSPFFEQLERLLRVRAPIRLGFPENQSRPSFESIPKRFPLCRRVLAPLYKRRWRQIQREFASEPEAEPEETPKDIFLEGIEAAAMYGDTWKKAVMWAATKIGALDIDDRIQPWARRWLKPAREVYRTARLAHLASPAMRRSRHAPRHEQR